MRSLLFISLLIFLGACGPKCFDYATGMRSYFSGSETMARSKRNGVFQFEMVGDKHEITLNNHKKFVLRTAWVENCWHYKCGADSPTINKGNLLQLIINADIIGTKDSLIHDYSISDGHSSFSFSNDSTGSWPLDYEGEDTITLRFSDNYAATNILKLYRKQTTE